MTIPEKIPALFVSPRGALLPKPGGLQVFTREHLVVLGAAGFDLTVLPYDVDMRFKTRLRRRLLRSPYADLLPPGLAKEVAVAQRQTGSRFVFFNVEETAGIAGDLQMLLNGAVQIILLSAGLGSVDEVHALRGKGKPASRRELVFLGRQLLTEVAHRPALDQVICLAPFEVEIERWLGAKQVDWLPRTVPDHTLNWQPDPHRLGCVSTLNHYPNMEGLTLFLNEFGRVAPPGAQFRLVGGPSPEGNLLSKRYPFLKYLGPLDDEALLAEAATWSCFVHPLFYYARGCSTKLAVALGWRLPVVTTSAGMRGYIWSEGNVPCADTPRELAVLAARMLDPDTARTAREQIRLVARSAPTVADIAARLRDILLPMHKSCF